MTKQQIIDSARQLSRPEQVDLAMELWDLVGPSADEISLTPEQQAELDRRIQSFQATPSDTRPWEEVRLEILRELDEKR